MRRKVLSIVMALLLCGMACAAAEDDIARIFAYENGVARYANAQGKIGLVGESGEILVPAIYDEIGMFDENGLAITFRMLDDETHYGLMDRSGRMVADDRDYTYIGAEYAGYTGFMMDCYTNHFGTYDATGADGMRYNILADGTVARFPDWLNSTHRLKMLNGNAYFIEGSVLLQEGSGWRMYDTDGHPLTDDVWDDCNRFPIGGGAVEKDGLWGIVDARGNLTADCRYDWMYYTHSGIMVCIKDEEKREHWGMISPETGEILVPLIYDDISLLSENRMAVKSDGLWGYLNENYEWAISPQWERAYDFSDHVAWVSDESGWYWQMIDENGQKVLDYHHFPAGGIVFYSPDYVAYCDETETITVHDHSGKTVLTLANALFSGENARVSDGRLPIIFGEEQGVGYLNLETGELLTPPLWDEADNFKDGLAIVVKDDLYGVIDREGNYVIEPVYSFVDRMETIEKVYFKAWVDHEDMCEHYVLNETGEVMCMTKEALW